VCEGVHSGAIDTAPWDKWVLDDSLAFVQLDFKAMVPLKFPLAEDVVWTIQDTFNQHQRAGKQPGARAWLAEHVHEGMAVAVEGLNRLPNLSDFRKQLFQELGIAAGIDLYMARVSPQHRSVGSYGWHVDSVDALIYVLKGRKRVRVAGHTPGGKITTDRILSAGSFVYVPGGRFHHLLAHPDADGQTTASWTKVLSFGLPNPNVDLLSKRLSLLAGAIRSRKLSWSAAAEVHLPKPVMRFSDVNAYDDTGRTALHRQAEAGSHMLALLLHQRADVHLRTRDTKRRGGGSVQRTALGLALCCASSDDDASKAAEALLDFRARTEAAELHSNRVVTALELAAKRPGLDAELVRRIRAAAASHTETAEL